MGALPKIEITEDVHDKVSEEKMAALLGITKKALQRRRERGTIPADVWIKMNSRIIYSLRRYDEWLESRWSCREVSSSSVKKSESASNGTSGGVAKRSPSLRPRKGSRQQQVYVLK